MDAATNPTRIVIIGGGFGGVKCAQTLRRHLSLKECEIVLFDAENHLVFFPLLAEVAGGLIHADAVSVPLRQMIPSVQCRREEVRQIDFEGRLVHFQGDGEETRSLPYDHVVIACGRVVNLTHVPGMADHALPLKKVGDAVLLRSRIIQQLEKAEVTPDPERRRRYLSFIIVGGGFSGVEMAGEINDFVGESARYYPHISKAEVRVTLIHAHDQILPEVGSPLREFARQKMEQAGIRFMLNAHVAMVTPDGVRLADGTSIPGATVVSTIGTSPASLVMALNAAQDRGSLLTESDLRLQGKTNAWAIGDCARILNAFDQKPSPTTAQFAERQGGLAAENIICSLRGQPTRPFYHKSLGQLCSIGGRRAVAELSGIRLSGFLAWFIWRGVYLFKMPTWSRRIKIGLEWAWDLAFGRDLTSVAPDLTERLSHAYYPAGDLIFRRGDPALNLYAVETGEVEVVQEDEGAERITAVLAAGDFFGEMALLEKRPHKASVRARTPVRVLVMGSDVFSHLSEALAPLKTLVLETAAQRESDALRRFPELRQALHQEPMSAIVEPVTAEPLRADETFEDVLALFRAGQTRCAAVIDENGALAGVVTFTDLIRATNRGAGLRTPVREIMTAHPACVTLSDSPELAVSTMRSHRLKWLPVVENLQGRRLVGWIHAQKLLERAMLDTSHALDKT